MDLHKRGIALMKYEYIASNVRKYKIDEYWYLQALSMGRWKTVLVQRDKKQPLPKGVTIIGKA